MGALQAMAQDKAPLEKKDLKIGFIAITCATPLIMADPLGFYKRQGLSVQLNKTAGWALIRDKMINKEHTTPRTSCRRCRWPSRWAWARWPSR
jgi:nitrate/nitrite transport system substrate-binding protein